MKQFKYEPLNLYVAEVYVTRVNGDDASTVCNPELEINELKLTDDFEKARRIKNLEICNLLVDKGFQSIELLTERVPEENELKLMGEIE